MKLCMVVKHVMKITRNPALDLSLSGSSEGDWIRKSNGNSDNVSYTYTTFFQQKRSKKDFIFTKTFSWNGQGTP